MSEPVLTGPAQNNVYGEHSFAVRVTFGATTVVTSYRSSAAIPTRPSATTVLITFPKIYAEVSRFKAGRLAAVSVAGLEWIITTNNIAVDGTVTLTSIVAAGTATAPASGDVAYFDFGVSCDQLNDRFTGP